MALIRVDKATSSSISPNFCGLDVPSGKYYDVNNAQLHDIGSTLSGPGAFIINCDTVSQITRSTGNGQVVTGFDDQGHMTTLSGNTWSNVNASYKYIYWTDADPGHMITITTI